MNINEFPTDGLLYIVQMERETENVIKLRFGLLDTLLYAKEIVNIVYQWTNMYQN
jgi:hypothetical protein